MAEKTVWTEPLAESNCYLLAEGDRCVVIDPNDPHGPLDVLESRRWTPDLILLTHEHCDHMAGLNVLRQRWPQARTVTTAACSAGVQSTRLNMSSMMEVYLSFHGKPGTVYPPFTCSPADETYTQTHTISWRGHRLRCIPLPGHTPGSAVIFWDENTLFSGDYLLPGEETVLRLPGGSQADYEAIAKPFLDALPEGLTICPGHGPSYTWKHG